MIRNCNTIKLSRYRHSGHKGERKYSSYSFLTSALDRVSGQHHAPASELIWTQRIETRSPGRPGRSKIVKSDMSPGKGVDTNTDRPTDRQS
jgi:hypothetical protein